MRALPHKDGGDVTDTMFLRPRNPDDHRDFNMLLPWLTPLFVYQKHGDYWVRWSMPNSIAAKYGMDQGCACCGENLTTEGDSGDVHVDTALQETAWWLTANGYAVPNPTEEELLQNATPSTKKENEK